MPAAWPPEALDAVNRLTTVARLLSTAVHETGNALQVISGNAEMIAAKPEDAVKAKDRAQRIKAHADQSATRLQGLASMVTATAGPPRRLDLRRLADRAVDLRRYSLSRADITVTVAGLTEVAVLGDELDVLRLIANLILNAERAVKGKPGPTIQVTLVRDGGAVQLGVADNGDGIPGACVDSIFEAFAPNRPPGCGLAVARWIAERHAGTLTVDRAAPVGARLVLTLPVAKTTDN